jgi:hypothetical protein
MALKNRIGGANDILDRRFDKSYLRIVNLENDGEASALPHSVSAITEIDIKLGYLRHMCPASCVLSFSPNCLDSALSMRIYGRMNGKTWICGKGHDMVGIRPETFDFTAR